MWPQCCRNRCLAHQTVWMPIVTTEAEQIERTGRRTWSRGPSEFLYSAQEPPRAFPLTHGPGSRQLVTGVLPPYERMSAATTPPTRSVGWSKRSRTASQGPGRRGSVPDGLWRPAVHLSSSSRDQRSDARRNPAECGPNADPPALGAGGRARRRREATGRTREEWDSNPRAPCGTNDFQDRRLRPLGHPPIRL